MLRSRAPIALLLGVLLCSGCTWGVSQLAMYPAIGGQYDFSGAKAKVNSPQDAAGNQFSFDLDLPARKGRVEPLAGFPQLTFGFDTPSWRLTINPSITGDDAASHFQADLYYKHLLSRSRHASWRLMAGISYASLSTESQESGVLQLDAPVAIDGAEFVSGDKVVYRSAATDSGVYLGLGIELELTTWLHLFAMVQARMNSSQGAEEHLEVIAAAGSSYDEDGDRVAETFDLLDDARFDTLQLKSRNVTSSLALPPMVALVGLSLNLPTWSWVRRTLFGRPPPRPRYYGRPPPPGWRPPTSHPPAARPRPPTPRAPPPTNSHPPPAMPHPGGH